MTNSRPESSATHSVLEKALSFSVGAFPWRRPRNAISELDLAATLAVLDRELLRLENENRLRAAVQAPTQARAQTGQILLFSRKRIG
jgi:hypothetical protein